MKTKKENPFRLETKYLIEDYRAFSNGPLSVCLDRFGGVESIRLLPVLKWGNTNFPERIAVDFFTRNRSQAKTMRVDGEVGVFHTGQFSSPAIQFASRLPNGALRYADTREPEVYPSAYISKGFEMAIRPDSVSFKIKVEPDGKAEVLFDPPRYTIRSGKQVSFFNQLAGWHEGWLTPEQRGKDFDSSMPFKDDMVELKYNLPEFDKKNQLLVFRIDRKYRCVGNWPLVVVLKASVPFTMDFQENRWYLTAKESSRTATFAFGFGDFVDIAAKTAAKALRDHRKHTAAAGSPETFPDMPSLNIGGMKEAAAFAEVFPHYQNAAVVHENENEISIRAAQDKFGYFILWDHLYPARDFLIMGQPERTEKALRYAVNYPHMEDSAMVPIQLLPAINEMLAFLPDSSLPLDSMDFFKKFFAFGCRWSDSKTGLFKNTLCLAVDFPDQAGLTGLFFESGMNSMWYNACRSLENFALLAGDKKFAEQARAQADKIAANYTKVFYDTKEKYLRTAVNDDGSLPKFDFYLYTNTWGLDYAHSLYLLRSIAGKLAEYQINRLSHPVGHFFSAPEHTLAGSGCIANHMNQHLGHECQCARFGGHAEEALRMMQGYLDWCSRLHNAVETFNYNYCSGDQTQRADWQTFSATAAMQGLVHGVCGLFWNRGGLFYMNAYEKIPAAVRNFHFRGKAYDFVCNGEGAYTDKIELNGKELTGSLQLPADRIPTDTDKVIWKIHRSAKCWTRPTLLFAIDAEIVELNSKKDSLSFTVNNTVHTSICFGGIPNGRCAVTHNGKKVSSEFLPDGRVWIDLLCEKGDRITVKTMK